MSFLKKAFTLSEVLITLGIIGIVAAMTMPSLINKMKNREKTARLKKFYSAMTQAIILSEQFNGPVSDLEKILPERDEDGNLIDNPDNSIKFFKKYLAPYIKILTIDKSASKRSFATFADGSVVYFTFGNCLDLLFDTNANKKPNSEGKDRFRFVLCTNDFNEVYVGKNKYFGTYHQDSVITMGREYAKTACKNNPPYCSTLLLLDNWEFKKDYPW